MRESFGFPSELARCFSRKRQLEYLPWSFQQYTQRKLQFEVRFRVRSVIETDVFLSAMKECSWSGRVKSLLTEGERRACLAKDKNSFLDGTEGKAEISLLNFFNDLNVSAGNS
jgi:hypothetical protein